MKTNSRKSIGLRATLVAFIATAIAFFAYAATINDLVPISSDFSWFAQNGVKISDSNFIDKENHFFLTGGNLDVKNDKGSDENRHYYSGNLGGRIVDFEIAKGKKADIIIYAANGISQDRIIRLRQNGEDVQSPIIATVIEKTVWTLTYTNIPAGKYQLVGDANAQLCGIEVKVSEAEKPAASLVAVTEDYQWRVKEGDILQPMCNNLVNEAQNTYYTFYTGGESVNATLLESNCPVIDNQPSWGYALAGNAVGFFIGKGKGTLTIYTGGNSWSVVLKKGGTLDGAEDISMTNTTSSGTVDGRWCITKTYTYKFDNSESVGYWIVENGGVLAGFDVKFDEEFKLEAPNLATITDDFSWICSDGGLKAGNNTPVTVDGEQKYYIYYNSTDGTNAGETTKPDTYLYGGGSLAYILDGKRLGFKVGADDYVIDFYTSADATVSLYAGDEPTTTTGDGIKSDRPVNITGASGKITRFMVREDKETTLWVEISGGALAGFDVMTNTSSVSEINGAVNPLPVGTGTWTPTSTELPYASGYGTLSTFKTGKGQETYFYHLGQTVALQSEHYNCVPLGDYGYKLVNAIGFRLDGARNSSVKIYAKGSGTYKVVKGNPLDADAAVAAPAVSVDGSPLTFELTTKEPETLWVVGDKTVYIEKIEYEVKKECVGPLTTIKDYYLWRAGDETVDYNKYFADNYLRHNNTSGNTDQLIPDSNHPTRVLGVETPTVVLTNDNEITLRLGVGTKGKVNVYYIGENTDLQMKYGGSEDTKQTSSLNTAVASNDAATAIQGTTVKTYSFDLSNDSGDRIVRIWNGNGNSVRIAAIEVIMEHDLTGNGQKNIDWYVCGDSKMIVGSERVDGNTEYAEYYVSKGRKPRVSFYMPSLTKLINITAKGCRNDEKGAEIDARAYKVTVTNGGSATRLAIKDKLVFDKKGEISSDNKDSLWVWMTRDWQVNPKSDNTQTFKIEATDVDENGNTRTWNVNLKFHYIDCPTISVSPEDPSNQATASVTMTKAKGHSSEPLYYTLDSTDPANKANTYEVPAGECEEYYSTKEYGSAFDVNVNCIALAAQFIKTDRAFYTDGPGSPTSNVFRLMSEQKYIVLQDRADIIYVKDPKKNTPFSKTAGDIDVLKVSGQPVMRFMYGAGTGTWDGAVKFFRIIDNEDRFRLGAVNWDGSKDAQDGGYDTYMDPYQYTLAGSDPKMIAKGTEINGSKLENDVTFNANPDTEMNGGIGGADTEEGGMFLQPVAGDFFRLEPEYDGIATVWVRQNGMVDYGNMYDGEITRRPVYVVDEDGVIQKGSTIKPTALHHLSINGVYASASGRNELRASFANTWKYATTYDEGWEILHHRIKRADGYFPMNYDVMQIWFGDILKFTTATGPDNYQHGAKKVPDAAPIAIDRANSVNLNRYSRIGTQILYRDDWMKNEEMKLKDKYPNATANQFAKYGYEIPNFGYVKYFIPVKAGKSYYIGGRGTKNGFAAMQFEPMPPNYNNKDYQREDNPNIVDGGGVNRATLDWTVTEPKDKKVYSAEDAVAAYNGLTTMTISDDMLRVDGNEGTYQEWWNWKDNTALFPSGDNMLQGATINVDLVREFEAGKWYPIVLPFSVSESRMREMFGANVKVLYLDPEKNSYSDDATRDFNSVYRPAIKDTELKFTYHYYQMLYANTPAFICPSEITTDSNLKETRNGRSVYHFRRVCFRGGDIKTYDIGGGYEVTGSYKPTTAADNGEMYYISNEDGKVVMYHSRNGIPMKGTRCWIRPKKGASHAPIMTMGFGSYDPDGFDDSGTTGVTDVISDDAPAAMYDNDNVYDIMGRIVAKGSTAGLPKGVYIFKGKKVYVK